MQMNISKIIRAFGHIDDKYLLEAEDAETKKSGLFRLKPVLLAAAIGVFALGTTVFAISRADGLSKMKYAFDRYSGIKSETEHTESPAEDDLTPDVEQDYTFYNDYTDSEIKDPTEFPWHEDLSEYGNEFEYDADIKTGEFRVTLVLMDDHCFYATVQYALSDDDLKALGGSPEGTVPTFSQVHFDGGEGYEGADPISLDKNIYTFAVSSLGFDSLPENVTFTIKNFGYNERVFDKWRGFYADVFHTIDEFDKVLKIPTSGLKKAESKKSEQVVYRTESGDVYLTAEISPMGIYLCYESEPAEAAMALSGDKYFLPYKLQICLDDGRIYGDGETFFELSYILSGRSGGIKNYNDGDPENDIFCDSLPFIKPAEISHVEKLTVDGCEVEVGGEGQGVGLLQIALAQQIPFNRIVPAGTENPHQNPQGFDGDFSHNLIAVLFCFLYI